MISIQRFLMALLLLQFFACGEVPEVPKKESTLMGTWNLQEVQWISKDTTYFLKNPQPGLLMLNKEGYSIMWSPSEKERTPFKVLSKPTDEELKSGFSSIVFNAGNYTITDSTLRTEATIAKVPGFEGGRQFFRYSIHDNQLSLVMHDETYPDGSKPEWSGLWQTKMIFDRKSAPIDKGL